MSPRDSARVVLVVFAFVVLQETVLLELRPGGIHPDVLVLLPVLAGLVGGPSRGAWMGFGAGLVADLFVVTPFGLSALVGCVVGFAVGLVTVALDRTAWWLAPLVALGASAGYELAFAAVGALLGQPQMLHVRLVDVVVVVAVVNAALALPARRVVDWALPAASMEGIPTSTLSGSGAR